MAEPTKEALELRFPNPKPDEPLADFHARTWRNFNVNSQKSAIVRYALIGLDRLVAEVGRVADEIAAIRALQTDAPGPE